MPGLSIKTNCLPAEHKTSGNLLGRLTGQIPLFKMTIVGPLPWGSRGRHKSKNPVNNHRQAIIAVGRRVLCLMSFDRRIG